MNETELKATIVRKAKQLRELLDICSDDDFVEDVEHAVYIGDLKFLPNIVKNLT